MRSRFPCLLVRAVVNEGDDVQIYSRICRPHPLWLPSFLIALMTEGDVLLYVHGAHAYVQFRNHRQIAQLGGESGPLRVVSGGLILDSEEIRSRLRVARRNRPAIRNMQSSKYSTEAAGYVGLEAGPTCED